jgi:F420-dependent oxidoreductase-like protein
VAKLIGVAVREPESSQALARIAHLEELGIPAVWLPTGGAGLDALTLIAAAALRTERIVMGTAIVPTFPRHPVVMVQQAQVIGQLAPGRFRLGIGSSHKPMIEDTYGIDFERPLGQVSEYLTVVRDLLHKGEVDFAGERFRVKARLTAPVPLPVMISALRKGAFELAGLAADGAISWVTPYAYLRDEALPAMRAAAARAGRPAPSLIAHTPVIVDEDRAAVREAAQRELAIYPRLPFYARMLAAAGYPEAHRGTWSDAMLDAVLISGDEATVAGRLREVLSFADEIVVTAIGAGANRAASRERTLRLLAEVAGSL